MKTPEVAIVVINWNGEEYIEDCLDSIYEKTNYPNYSVTVVDNGSEDRSTRIVKQEFPEAELIEKEKNLGFSIAANIGIKENKGAEYFLLLNNDMEVKKGWLDELVRVAESRKVAGIVGSKLLYPDGLVQHAGVNFSSGKPHHIGHNEDPKLFTEDREVEYVTGASFLINRTVFEQIGYLDEIFTPALFEETDYCSRAKEAGFKIYFAANSEIIHYEGKSRERKKSEFIYFCYQKNFLKFLLMNATGKDFLIDVFQASKYLLASILGYGFNPMSALMAAYKEVLQDLPVLIYKRYNREEFVPSYFCSDAEDYSKRYDLD